MSNISHLSCKSDQFADVTRTEQTGVGYERVVLESGTVEYWVDGVLHREGKPAIEWSSGNESWYFDGKLHNDCGPAIWQKNGTILEWWLHGKRLFKKDFTDFELIDKLGAWSIFTPVEIIEMKKKFVNEQDNI